MPLRLIINADDFGLTPGINRAIIELHQAGVVSSATLMATGFAFKDAVALALANPRLGVGCHVVLVDGTPVSPPKDISTLLGPDRQNFRASLSTFVRDLFLGRIDLAEVEREALAQVQQLQGVGIHVTHLDTHKHTHVFPSVGAAILAIADKAGVPALRYPFEPRWPAVDTRATPVRRAQLALLRRFEPATASRLNPVAVRGQLPSGTLGIAATGRLSSANLYKMLAALCTGHDDGNTFELCCHPGYCDSDLEGTTTRLRAEREIERQALMTVVPQIFALPNAPQLIHYGDLGRHP